MFPCIEMRGALPRILPDAVHWLGGFSVRLHFSHLDVYNTVTKPRLLRRLRRRGKLVLYPLLRVEIPEIKIERVGNRRPGLFGPVSMEPLDLEIDSHFGSLATAKGDSLAKLAPQLPIGARLRGR